MNIGPPTDPGWSPIDLKATPARGAAAAPAQAPAPQAGVTVAAGMSQLAHQPASELDARKVEQVRQAIAEGRFTIRADMIADRLIADAAALLGPRAAGSKTQ